MTENNNNIEDKKDRLVVYTALFGDYDDLIDPPEKFEGCDFVCFTDQKHLKSDIWEIRLVEDCDLPPNMMNRKYKILPHLFLPEYVVSLYVDSNVGFTSSPAKQLLDMGDSKIMAYEHQFRNDIHEEARVCAQLGYDFVFKILKQLKRYFDEGFAADGNGLYECNVLYRVHNDEVVISSMIDWWSEYVRGIKRDQITFPYVVWKNSLHIKSMGITDLRTKKAIFTLAEGHKKPRILYQRVVGKLNQVLMRVYE